MSGDYTLDNAQQEAATRMRVLEELYDTPTFAQFDAIGVGPGWRCWEVGAGGGSAAAALAARGATVTVTDTDLRWLSEQARQAGVVLRHDVTTDEPFPGMDLIHARLVASHLPTWPQVLPRLVAALAPGGWLVLEELDPMTDYQPAPATATDVLVNRVGRAFTAVLASRGGQPQLGRRLRRQLDAAGLEATTSYGLVVEGRGGEPVAELMAANVAQTAPLLAAQGITGPELAAYTAALANPGQYLNMPTFWLARGRKPVTA